MKLKANALFITIVISMIIALMTGMLILSAYYNKTSILYHQKKERLIRNANSGLSLILSGDKSLMYNTPFITDLFEGGDDSVCLNNHIWGIFEIATCTAFKGKDSCTVTALCGYKPDSVFNSALYLSDQSRALFLCGNTKIKGNCFLPEAGVKRAYIEGQGYIHHDLIDGKEKTSNSALPKLDNKICQHLNSQFIDSNAVTNNTVIADTIINSFAKPTLIIEINNSIYTLDQKVFQGNVVIKSKGKIIITAQNSLSNIQIFAPSIVVEERFKGAVQLFANDSLVIKPNCHLQYPSALGIIKNKYRLFQQFIRLEDGSQMEGIVFGYCTVTDLNKILISVQHNAQVYGQVFADGFAEIKGTVIGHVTCQHFRLRTPSSTYDNHLLNATIDFSKLSKKFVGSALLSSENEKKAILNLE